METTAEGKNLRKTRVWYQLVQNSIADGGSGIQEIQFESRPCLLTTRMSQRLRPVCTEHVINVEPGSG